jgi:predicted permease
MSLWLEQLGQDLRYGARALFRSPGITAVAFVSLALGITATTAIYSVLHAVVLDPFPYRDVDNLMSVRVSNAAQRGFRTGYSVDQFLEIAERSTIFEGVIASTISDVLWTGAGDPQRLRGNHGTFNTFDVMGVPALMGRTPTADDARPGAEPVAVLGYRFWQRRFAGDPQVIGQQLQLNGIPRTVIGVMPKRFMWRGADVYLPITFTRGQVIEGVRGVHLLGRLKPAVTEAQAEADLSPIIADLKAREPQLFPDQWRVGLLPFKQTFPSAITRDIWILLGAVVLLLLIACANVSNLLLSKASDRQREMTVRAALGANRQRIVRQLLTESLLLALAAGALGTLLAYVGLPAILALVPPDTIPDESEVLINMPVLAFALITTVVTSVLCGLAPALYSSKRDLASSMREVSRGVAGHSRQALLRKMLVVAEVALSLMLLAGSGVLLRTFVAMMNADPGVPPDRVLTLRVPLSPERYPNAPRRVAFFKELLPRIASVPGVRAVGINTGLHPLGNMWTAIDVAGEPPSSDPVQVHQVNAGYIAVFDRRIAAGRLLSDDDVEGARPVVLVNERFARTRVAGRSALGLTVRVPRLKQPPFNVANDTFQIVGVLQDALNAGTTNPAIPEVFLPYTVAGASSLVAVRTEPDPANVTRTVIERVYEVDKGQPVTNVMTLEALIAEDEYATPRFNLILLSVFALVGLALAIVGVYGMMSSAVAQERHEIGVRMALGASAGTIVRMILTRGTRLLVAGAAIGLVASAIAGRWLASAVWNVSAFDPLAFGTVAVILLVAGLQACLWPAIRAARIDPISTLRE